MKNLAHLFKKKTSILMLSLSARRARQKLIRLMSESPPELFFQMVWAVDQLQKPYGTDVRQFLKYPPEAKTSSIKDPHKIHSWELEDLVNAKVQIPYRPKLKKRQIRALACDQFRIMAIFINNLRKLYNGYSHSLNKKTLFSLLGKLKHKQFEWQRGFAVAQNIYQCGYIYGGDLSKAYFAETYGFGLDKFAFGMMAIQSAFLKQPRLPLPITIEDLTQINQAEINKICAHVSLPLNELREFSNKMRGNNPFLEYSISVLRKYPCILMPDNSFMSPISELCAFRMCEGVFYDLVSAPGGVRREIGARFEQYSIDIIIGHQPKLYVRPEINYGTKQKPKLSPDILIGRDQNVEVVIECKATKMPISRKFGDNNSEPQSDKIDEIAKGVCQVWEFFSDYRNGKISDVTISDNAVGLVLCLDPWTGFSYGYWQEIKTKAIHMADKRPHIEPVDRRGVALCGLDDFSSLLRLATEDRLIEVIRVASDKVRQDWLLNNIHDDLFKDANAKREVDYKNKIGEVYPDLGGLFKRIDERLET